MYKTVAFHTLGCKLNFSETSTLSRNLESDGFIKTNFDDIADVYVINTCSVTENANKECKQLIRKIKKRSPNSNIIITGCYAQLKPHEIAQMEGVDLVLGAEEKFNLPKHIKDVVNRDKNIQATKICSCDIDTVSDFHSSFSVNDRTRAFLKVQDGCDYGCTYCTIPLARGKSRSNTIQGVLNNLFELDNNGTKEVVLTGVNLGDFYNGIQDGDDKQSSFLDLLNSIENVRNFENIKRIRLSSIEPNLLTNEIIQLVANSTIFMPHFHIPLQSGSNKILNLMRRRYQKQLYEDRISYIKKLIPHCCIGADVIVGFPTESDLDFEETFKFIESIDVSYLHVFTYSERENTLATDLKPIVPINIRNHRNKLLRDLSEKKLNLFVKQNNGTIRKVLFEANIKNNIIEGYTDNYIKIEAPFKKDWVNEIIDWEINNL